MPELGRDRARARDGWRRPHHPHLSPSPIRPTAAPVENLCSCTGEPRSRCQRGDRSKRGRKRGREGPLTRTRLPLGRCLLREALDPGPGVFLSLLPPRLPPRCPLWRAPRQWQRLGQRPRDGAHIFPPQNQRGQVGAAGSARSRGCYRLAWPVAALDRPECWAAGMPGPRSRPSERPGGGGGMLLMCCVARGGRTLRLPPLPRFVELFTMAYSKVPGWRLLKNDPKSGEVRLLAMIGCLAGSVQGHGVRPRLTSRVARPPVRAPP
jgi:hypothetical protein